MRILVVDDSKSIRNIVAECLKSMGHEVINAENGQQCVDYVSCHDVDLILMDIEMPGINGVDATKAIRALNNKDWFPIVFLSSRNDDQSFTDGILAGGDAYLAKPINPLRLQLTIIAMQRIYQMRQALQLTRLELETANKELQRLSFFDQLTGLANRRNYDITLEKQYALAKTHKSPLSLIICDIDYFKLYNDNYGHQQGDKCLAQVANQLKLIAKRPTDLACRYGGEEFTIILANTSLQEAKQIAENIRIKVVEQKIPHQGSSILEYVTVSVGISTFTGQFKSASELTKVADMALYRAKELGRNRCELALELN